MAVFAGDALKILHLQVLNQNAAEAVGVWKLIACGIDLKEEGVALIQLVAKGILPGERQRCSALAQ